MVLSTMDYGSLQSGSAVSPKSGQNQASGITASPAGGITPGSTDIFQGSADLSGGGSGLENNGIKNAILGIMSSLITMIRSMLITSANDASATPTGTTNNDAQFSERERTILSSALKDPLNPEQATQVRRLFISLLPGQEKATFSPEEQLILANSFRRDLTAEQTRVVQKAFVTHINQ